MGSPISSVLAQLVLEDLEENTISNLNFNLKFFKRYVDDCLTIVPENKCQYVLNQFNNYHPNVKFTLEKEKITASIFRYYITQK